MTIRSTTERLLKEGLSEAQVPVPESFPDDLVLLKSGLDSIGFAVLVTHLESELGFDPFTRTCSRGTRHRRPAHADERWISA